MYATIIDVLKQIYNYKEFAPHKETLAIWAKLGMDYKKIRCNCIW
jgi:spore photoproduct lyase